MSQRRVVVTGMGAVTPIGITVDSFWDSLLRSASGVRTVTRFNTSGFDVRIGAECLDFKGEDHIDRKTIKRMDRFVQFALVAAREAYNATGLTSEAFDPDRVGVIVGSGIGGLLEIEAQKERLILKGPGKVSAFTIPKLMVNAASGNISIDLGFRGPSTAISTACASATDAMGSALENIRRGRADIVFTGGTEAALTPLGLSAFAAMKALSVRDVPPEQASCPFDAERDGFVLGEGAAVVVFEEYEHAKKRGAPILAEVAGYGATSDANHITQPTEDGVGAAAAMSHALENAGVNPDDVSYINAHGTATPLGDVAETIAIKRVFGDAARQIPISSTKSSIGHLLGASGGAELVATVNAIVHGIAPPTINLHHPDPECDLDYVPNTPRDLRINVAMSNSFGFGGHNACIVLKRIK
jgi:3-oxoacyl-[acyl-carrier-protein] synthase II